MGRRTIKVFTIILGIFSIGLLAACYYDVEQELYPGGGCNTVGISYSSDVVSILTDNGCLSCHGDLATIDLTGYTDFKKYVDNGSIVGSIEHSQGFRPMPDNAPKISQCSINKIKAWIADGAADN